MIWIFKCVCCPLAHHDENKLPYCCWCCCCCCLAHHDINFQMCLLPPGPSRWKQAPILLLLPGPSWYELSNALVVWPITKYTFKCFCCPLAHHDVNKLPYCCCCLAHHESWRKLIPLLLRSFPCQSWFDRLLLLCPGFRSLAHYGSVNLPLQSLSGPPWCTAFVSWPVVMGQGTKECGIEFFSKQASHFDTINHSWAWHLNSHQTGP